MTASKGAKPTRRNGKEPRQQELLEVCKRETAAIMPGDASDRQLEGSGGN